MSQQTADAIASSPTAMAPSGPRKPMGSAPGDPYLNTTIDGRYKVEAILGEGGMGVVYLARHKVIDKRVAIKILRADMARDREMTERFLQEAKAASSIGNPHIIDISDFGELPDGSTYFVMEYLDGKPLTKVLEESKPLPGPRLISVTCQIADALAAAHQRGIVHRDLKPDNIFLVKRGSEPDFVKILDFGIAKVSTGTTSKLTRAGSVFGTPHYMSPEQAAGVAVDSRTDIYALGIILYEMASGQVPFDADNFMGILTKHMYQTPVPIRALVPPPDVSPALEAVIMKALSKKPEQRFQTMDELAADLQKIGRGETPDALPEMMNRSGGFSVPADFFNRGMPAPVPATPRQAHGGARWGVYAGVAGVLMAIGIVVAIFAKSSSSTASQIAPAPSVAQATVAPPIAAQPAPAAPNASAELAPPVEVKHVLVASDPLDTHVFLDGQDLGSSPVTVDVPVGQKVSIEIRRDGYKTQSFTLDGSQRKLTPRLARQGATRAGGAAPRPASEPAARPAAPAPIGGGEIVNPWAK